MTELHPIIYDLSPSVARVIFTRYRAYVEKEDLVQECYAWAASRTAFITEQLLEENEEQRKHAEQRIAWQMRRAVERYARKQKASQAGYQISDEAYYESATVAQLLPFVIASVVNETVLEQAQDMIRDGSPKGSTPPSEGGNLLASLLDIKNAFLKLDIADKRTLTQRYHENLTLQEIANAQECALSTADKRCSTALRKLLNHVGGESPWK